MAITNPLARDLKKTQTYMENLSFDPTYEVLTRIPLTLNPVTSNLERPTAFQGNASFVLTYTSSNLTGVAMTIGGTTYNKTLTYDGSNNLTAVSVWT